MTDNKEMVFTLTRQFDTAKQTMGMLQAAGYTARWCVIEKPWKDNQHQISCIPKGTYKLTIEKNPTFGECFRVNNVKDRDGILIHAGNYNSDTHGCILPGSAFMYINKDGDLDTSSSVTTLGVLVTIAKKYSKVTLVIV